MHRLALVWQLMALWTLSLGSDELKETSEAKTFSDFDLRPFTENFYSPKYDSRIISPIPVRAHRPKPVFVSVNPHPSGPINNHFIEMLKQRHTQLQRQKNVRPNVIDQQVVPANNILTQVRGSYKVQPMNNNPVDAGRPLPSSYHNVGYELPRNQPYPKRPTLGNQHYNSGTPFINKHHDLTHPIPSNQQDDGGSYMHKLVQFPSKYKGILTYFQANNRPDLSLWTGSLPSEEPKKIEIYTRNQSVPLNINDTNKKNVAPYTIFQTQKSQDDQSSNKRLKIRKVKFPRHHNPQQMFVTNSNNDALQQSEDSANSFSNFVVDLHPRHKQIQMISDGYEPDDKHPYVQDLTRGTRHKSTTRDTIEEYHKKWKSKNNLSEPDTKNREPKQKSPEELETVQPLVQWHNNDDHMQNVQSLIRDVTSSLGTNITHIQPLRGKHNLTDKTRKKKVKRLKKNSKHKYKDTKYSDTNQNRTTSNAKTSHGKEYNHLNRSRSHTKPTDIPKTPILLMPLDVNGNLQISDFYNYDNHNTGYNNEMGMKNMNPTRTSESKNTGEIIGNTETNMSGDLGYSVLLIKDKNNNYRTMDNLRHKKNEKVVKGNRKQKGINQNEQHVLDLKQQGNENNNYTQYMVNTEVIKNNKLEKNHGKRLTKTRKSQPNKYLSVQNYQHDNSKLLQNATIPVQNKRVNFQRARVKNIEILPTSTYSTSASTDNEIGETKAMSMSESTFAPQVAYKVSRNGDGTYETAYFQGVNNNQEDDEEDDTDAGPENEDRDGQESSHRGNRRVIETDPEEVDDDVEDAQLREEDEKENNKIRDHDRTEDEDNKENDDLEDEEVQSDMDFDRIKESIDRIDEEPDDEETLESEEEETLFMPEDYDEEDDQDREQSKSEQEKYMLMPFFLKVPKQRNKRSTLSESDAITENMKQYGAIFLRIDNSSGSKVRKKRKTLNQSDRVESWNQEIANGTDGRKKWQIPIFMIGSEEKESKEKSKAENKKLYSSVKITPIWKENTFVNAEAEFNVESSKAMNANKREDAKKKFSAKNKEDAINPMINTVRSTLGSKSFPKRETPLQLKEEKNKNQLHHLKQSHNDLKNVISGDIFDDSRKDIREKRKMFVLNKKYDSAINSNNAPKIQDDEQEKERGLINRINTYTYVQMGAQPLKQMNTNHSKKVSEVSRNTKRTAVGKLPSTTKTTKNSPMKRFDQYRDDSYNNYKDEAEEIKNIQRINKYTEQSNKIITDPVKYTSTRRKFSLQAQPVQSVFKKDTINQYNRESIPVSERFEEGFNANFRADTIYTPRKIFQNVQKILPKSGKTSSSESSVVEVKDSKLQAWKIKPTIMNKINHNVGESENRINYSELKQPTDKIYRYKIDLTSPEISKENIDESKAINVPITSSEETPYSTEIKKSEPEPVSPDERKNFRKYSKKRVKEVVIKSATEEPIVRTTVKITDESSKYPTLTRATHKNFKGKTRNNEKETITNHVKYERKIKKENIGSFPNSLFDTEKTKETTDSMESQESNMEVATSSSILAYNIANNTTKFKDQTVFKDNTDTIISEPSKTLGTLKTNSAPKYYKTIIQESGSEDSPKTTYYEEVDYKTTRNPNYEVGIPGVNYDDNNMVVENYSTTQTSDVIIPESVYGEMYAKQHSNKSNRNPLFNSNDNTNSDEYEHQVQKPNLHEVNQESNQRETNPHNEKFDFHPIQNVMNSITNESKYLTKTQNPYHQIFYEDPTGEGFFTQNGSHRDESLNDNYGYGQLFTTDALQNNEKYDLYETTTEHPHHELTEEFESDNIKNHNVNRHTAVFPNKQSEYYEDNEEYVTNTDDGNVSMKNSADNQETLAYNTNPYLNHYNSNSKERTNEDEFPVEQLDPGGPKINYYEEDKKYLSESKKIKEHVPEDYSGNEDDNGDHSGNADYDNGYSSSTPVDAKAEGQELNDDHKQNDDSDEDYKKGTGDKYESDTEKSKGKKTKENYDNYHEEEHAKKGHKKKEKHNKKYHDAKEEKRKHQEEQEHYGKHREEEEGEKGAKFEESGSHEKGHSTKGEHNIHKLNEYMKKHEFYDEHHDGGEHEKHGGFQEAHNHSKGKKEKAGHRSGKHEAGALGRKGRVNHGKQYKDHEKVASGEGAKKHRFAKKQNGEAGERKVERKWGDEKHDE